MADATSPLASKPELNTFVQRTVDDALAAMVLAQASAAIRNHCGWHIAPVAEDDALTINGNSAVVLPLPTAHVTAVASVVEDGTTLTADDHYEWSAAGYLPHVGDVWTTTLRGVVATVTHGYQNAPEDVKSVCLQFAARLLADPSGVKSETAGGVSVTYGQAGGLTEFEIITLSPYRVANI